MGPAARSRLLLVGLAIVAALLPAGASSQVDIHPDGTVHSHGLHFSHPVFTESVTPDTKVRLDFGSVRAGDGGEASWSSEVALEAEYAFHRSFSVEIQLPYLLDPGDVGETHVGLKFANYAFEDSGVLLGYGLDFGLPTGSHVEPGARGHHAEEGGDHGHAEGESDIYELEPFLNIGWMKGRWELVGFAVFGIPTNHADGEAAGTEVSFDASVLYHATNRLEALLEYDARSGLSGPEAGTGFSNVSPGLKFQPLAGRPLLVGLGASFPAIDRGQFDTRLRMSAFYHF